MLRGKAWWRPVGALVVATASFSPTIAAVSDEQWQQLVGANEQLMEMVAAQQAQIDELRQRLDSMPVTGADPGGPAAHRPPPATPASKQFEPARTALPTTNRILFSGEAAASFFSGGADSKWPHDEFRVEEAQLAVETEILRGIYLVAGLDLSLREANDEFVHLGEAYVEFDNLSAAWGHDGALTLRLGRFDIPFGEEYQYRNPIDNPLISHSLADLWGVDEGIEIFGRVGPVQYTLAAQNGGHPTLRDWNQDKAVVARLGFNPARNWQVSGSVMRTGDLDAGKDRFSELWIGDGFFRSIGDPATTSAFGADLAQLDAAHHWHRGHLKLAMGQAWYDDDDTAADNSRTLRFVSLEGMQRFAEQWYGAVRYSRILTDAGYPLAGNGPFGRFIFGLPTRDISRVGVGVGFRPDPNLVFKMEYTFEDGNLISGASRGDQDQFSAQAAVRF